MGSAQPTSPANLASAGRASTAFWITDRVNRTRHHWHTKTQRAQKHQSILLTERSSWRVALPSFREPVSLYGVAFPIKSSMDVIRVPIDTEIFPTLCKDTPICD